MRTYTVLVAATQDGIDVAARDLWTVLRNTVKEFGALVTNDDQQMGDIGQVRVDGAGWVALAYRDGD